MKKKKHSHSMLERFLQKVAHAQVEHPVLSLMIILFFTLAIMTGVSQVKTVASLEQMMPANIDEIKAFHTLRDNQLGQDAIAVVISLDQNSILTNPVIDIRDPLVTEYVNTLHEEIMTIPDIVTAESLYNMDPSYVYSSDYTKTLLVAYSDVGADDPRMLQLAEHIVSLTQEISPPPGVQVQFTGTPIIQQKLGELISHDRSTTQWISTALVFIIVAILFTNISSAIVPIIIVTLSVNWLYGTMGYTNLPISTLAGGVAAMVIGIGIDFAIHIMNKFKFDRKKGMSQKKAIEAAVMQTGVALIATTATTVAAFLAFLSGQMPEMGRFGILMSIGILYSLVFSLFGLPALLILEEKIIGWIKGHMTFGIEHEYHLEDNDDR